MSESEPEAWTFSVGDDPVDDPVAAREAAAAAAAAAEAAAAADGPEPEEEPTGVWARPKGLDDDTWATTGLDADASWEGGGAGSARAWGEDDDLPAWGAGGATDASEDLWGDDGNDDVDDDVDEVAATDATPEATLAELAASPDDATSDDEVDAWRMPADEPDDEQDAAAPAAAEAAEDDDDPTDDDPTGASAWGAEGDDAAAAASAWADVAEAEATDDPASAWATDEDEPELAWPTVDGPAPDQPAPAATSAWDVSAPVADADAIWGAEGDDPGPAVATPAAEDVLESLLAEAEADAELQLPPVVEVAAPAAPLEELVAAAERAVTPPEPAAPTPTPEVESSGDEAVWTFSIDDASDDASDDDPAAPLAEVAEPRPDRGWLDADAAAEPGWPDVAAPPSRYREGGEPDAFVALSEAATAAADEPTEVGSSRVDVSSSSRAAEATTTPASMLDEILDATPGGADELDPIPLPSAAQDLAGLDDLGLDDLGLGLDDMGFDDPGGTDLEGAPADPWADFEEAAHGDTPAGMPPPTPGTGVATPPDEHPPSDGPATPAVPVDLANFSAGGHGRSKGRRGRRKG